MEGIIYNNQAQADALMIRLNQRVSRHFKGLTNSWSFIKKHPTQSKVAFIIDRTAPHWDEIEAEITPNEVNNIVTLGNDWFPSNII